MKKILKNNLPPKIFYFLKRKLSNQFDERRIIYDLLDYKGGTMLDVGSMDGSSFMPFLLNNWTVFAFEPDKKNYNLIHSYLMKWNLNASLHKKAVSDIVEKKTFYKSLASTGIPSLLKFNKDQVPSHEVNTITLKDFIHENNITEVDFLKIDVEGYDFNVIKGNDFNLVKPRVILSEFEDKKTKLLGYSTKDMAKYLLDKGYFIVYSIWDPIQEYGIKHTWRKMSININEIKEFDWGNIIAFKNELDFNEFREKHKI
ncbi:MAG: FkbM family methyltransferase [Polaribacter sp.]